MQSDMAKVQFVFPKRGSAAKFVAKEIGEIGRIVTIEKKFGSVYRVTMDIELSQIEYVGSLSQNSREALDEGCESVAAPDDIFGVLASYSARVVYPAGETYEVDEVIDIPWMPAR